tara:strand:- start:5339 stop:6460 length:1122 start_codon:yes stop_codon:yes gene_type:complete
LLKNIIKKNFGIIIEDPRIGGPHKQLIYLINSITKDDLKNFQITLFLPKTLNKYIKNKMVKVVNHKIIYLTKNKVLSYMINFFKDINFLSKLYNKYDIDNLYIAGGSQSIKSIISGIISKKKIIWHIHDTNCSKIIKIIFNFLSIFVDKILFVSEKSKKYYLPNKSNVKAIKMRPSIDLNYFKIREKKKFNNKILNIGVIANINPDKDIVTLIKVANLLKNEKIFINVYGNVWNSQRKYFQFCVELIKKYSVNNIKFHFNVKDIKKCYLETDILLCTSKNESLPMVVCEAMAMGLPIFSTDVGDIKKFVNKKNNLAGMIFEPGDSNKISKQIIKISNERYRLKKYSLNSIFLSKRYFNIVEYKKNLLNILYAK